VPGTGHGASRHCFVTFVSHGPGYGRSVPRLARDQGPGYFHVTTRGNDGRDIYLTVDDRRIWLVVFKRVARKLEWAVPAWCQMTNHFHLALAIEQPNLSSGMQQLNGLYAQWFNAWYERTGHLFGRRFWAKRIEDEKQLRDTADYIFHNPVRAGLCASPWDWRWLGGSLLADPPGLSRFTAEH
jgi:putative transposase